MRGPITTIIAASSLRADGKSTVKTAAYDAYVKKLPEEFSSLPVMFKQESKETLFAEAASKNGEQLLTGSAVRAKRAVLEGEKQKALGQKQEKMREAQKANVLENGEKKHEKK